MMFVFLQIIITTNLKSYKIKRKARFQVLFLRQNKKTGMVSLFRTFKKKTDL